MFLDYFQGNGHTVVPSASLLPDKDPTLLFTNAGMVPFKNVFVGLETRPYVRAASAQKCLRVSGKHNDLEEVGRTARHHTFFEMLGNFSFGDYFKEQAIRFAWDLVRLLGLDTGRIWVTVFAGAGGLPADDEARALWQKVGVPAHRILGMGMKENFWAMGDTGPCGPCTELHFDLGGPGDVTLDDFASGRVVEFWNNVFMQFNRHGDGRLEPLAKPAVDTGMGLERLAALAQGKTSNYDSDLFVPLLHGIAGLAGKPYGASAGEEDVSMRVIADHARAAAFLVADGVSPSNEGVGYVLRRIMRRAIRHGRRLGMEGFYAPTCAAVVERMGEAYPELVQNRALIEMIASQEEQAFLRTLDAGTALLERAMDGAPDDVLDGAVVFKLYDTYGFPKDLTELMASERGLRIDDAGFDQAMAAQRSRSRGSLGTDDKVSSVYLQLHQDIGDTEFVGYAHEELPLEARVGRWREHEGHLQTEVEVAAVLDGEVVLQPTPYYGESGGQVGDRGLLQAEGLRVEVEDTVKPVPGLSVSRVRVLEGTLAVGQKVWAGYAPLTRRATRAHHSATHLLHHALRQVLGDHVRQAGSLVEPDRLRFDYTHFEPPTKAQWIAVEDEVNRIVSLDRAVFTEVLPLGEAKARSAVAFFGDKYGAEVRMVSMGPSVELCGGTHVARTSDIGYFLLCSDEAVQSGVRRVDALVNKAATAWVKGMGERLTLVHQLLAGDLVALDDDAVVSGVAKQAARAREAAYAFPGGAFALPEAPIGLTKARWVRDLWRGVVALASAKPSEVDALSAGWMSGRPDGLLRAYRDLVLFNADRDRQAKQSHSAQAVELAERIAAAATDVGGIRLVAARVQGVAGKDLRELADRIRDRMPSGVLCLCSDLSGKAALLVAVTQDLQGRFHAGTLVQDLAPLIGGRGGGRADMAQAGGSDPNAADAVFAALRAQLGGTP
jgi:alanyl-tRNA synthetase